MAEHMEQLLRVGYFVCPDVNEVNPARIPEGMEYVEILTGGKLRFEIDGEEKVFVRGAVFWHKYPETTICKTFADDPYRCIVLHFKVRTPDRPGPRVSVWDSPDETVSFADECRKAFHSGNADMALLSGYAYSVLTWKASARSGAGAPECPKVLLEACDFIERKLKQRLTPEIIASHLNLSRPYLFALFKKHFGKAPLHYVQERRIAKAKMMLTAGDGASIKEIAMLCGFETLEVFYRQFKKQSGLTPAEYRKKYSVMPL